MQRKLTLSIFLMCLLSGLSAKSQGFRTISGVVLDSPDYEPSVQLRLNGAVVFAPGTSYGTIADSGAHYTLVIPDTTKYIVASFSGYLPDTLKLVPGLEHYWFVLKNAPTLKEYVVNEKLRSTELSLTDPMYSEKIGQGELLKAACCNLGESFENSPSVDVAFSDAVTGYKQVRLLGLTGPYTLITQENIPNIRGLASITGLTYTPGTWIESMQLSKGAGSVVNGFESVAGQINVELRKPFDGEKMLFNLYQSTQGRTEGNINFRKVLSKKIGTNLLVHGGSQWLKIDQNKDNFIDQPLGKQFDLLNRWIYNDPKGWMVQAGVKLVYADGVGGEWAYKNGDAQSAGHPWGFKSNTKRLEDWLKVARIFSSRPATSLGLQLANTEHDQSSQYGAREYTGKQNSIYANLIFQTYINTTDNIIKAGISNVMDQYTEKFAGVDYSRNEIVPGAFCEYSYSYLKKFNLVAGLRVDNNNLYGAFITPRLHMRYALSKHTTLRASGGRAQRTANILSENAGFMASSRQFDILGTQPGKAYGLNPEVAWNTGLNLTHKFKMGRREAVFSCDYYYTQFVSQVVVDVDYPGYVSFYNLKGKSYSHSFSMQLDHELAHNLNLKLAYRYTQVMTTYSGVLEERPLVPPHRAFANLDYATRNKWKFDYTIQWISSERTPGITHNHSGISPGGVNKSPSFIQMNMQVTKVFSSVFEVYLGGENLTNYMQHDAIVGAADPFGRQFDASMIWGPMMGRNIYVGFRYKLM